MSLAEVYADLDSRLVSAEMALRQMAHGDARLLGKAQGVALALDYLRSYRVHLENDDA